MKRRSWRGVAVVLAFDEALAGFVLGTAATKTALGH
jgi:hypothetical protein